jgi:hypothetical protein
VVEDLETLQTKLSTRFGSGSDAGTASGHASNEGFSDYTMHEERVVAGVGETESGGGDVELF